jgi:hypothetical protein
MKGGIEEQVPSRLAEAVEEIRRPQNQDTERTLPKIPPEVTHIAGD